MFKCDERQITQVLTNLLKNSAEAIDESGDRDEKGRISVSVVHQPDRLDIIIEDNGIRLS